MRWIFPILIALLTIAVANNWWKPIKEKFDMIERFEQERTLGSTNGESIGTQKNAENKDENDKSSTEKMKEKDNADEEELKEDFETFDNTAEVLRKGWRHKPMPQPLQPYYGPIRGYNCEDYSEFRFDTFMPPCLKTGKCESTWIVPGTQAKDYIFPGKIAYKGEVPLTPYFLNHEEDVVNKRIEAEQTEINFKLSASDADHLDRPNYMYHRGDHYWNPVLSKETRYNVKYSY